jgi:hypothetical protein
LNNLPQNSGESTNQKIGSLVRSDLSQTFLKFIPTTPEDVPKSFLKFATQDLGNCSYELTSKPSSDFDFNIPYKYPTSLMWPSKLSFSTESPKKQVPTSDEKSTF